MVQEGFAFFLKESRGDRVTIGKDDGKGNEGGDFAAHGGLGLGIEVRWFTLGLQGLTLDSLRLGTLGWKVLVLD